MNSQILTRLMNRMSTNKLVEPAPSEKELLEVVQLATTVPDHGKLSPYLFHVFTGKKREQFGDALLSSALEKTPDLSDSVKAKIEAKAQRAPMIIAIVCKTKKCKIPRWEQEATTACAGYAICQGLDLQGYGAVWKSSSFDSGSSMRSLLEMDEDSSLLGWINVGSVEDEHFEQVRPSKAPEEFLKIH